MMIDKRGIAWFLGITFVITWGIELVMVFKGWSFASRPPMMGQLIVASMMWVPALGALVTTHWISGEKIAALNIRFGPLKPYLFAALLMPLVFATVYGITWLLGLGEPDWQLAGIKQMILEGGGDVSQMPSSSVLIPGLFLISIVVGPTINGLFGFGEEIGWRGFLLPKLMPLGKWKAYLILGIIWGLWHAPLILIGFNYPGYPFLGILCMIGVTTALGIYTNELTLRYKSSVLAGSIHGAFNGQVYGIWRIMFPEVNPILGGITGIVGIIILTLVGYLTVVRLNR